MVRKIRHRIKIVSFKKFSKVSDVGFRANVFWYLFHADGTRTSVRRRARQTWREVVVARSLSMRMIVGEDAVCWHSLSERLVLCLEDFSVTRN